MKITIYHNNRCSKSREVLNSLTSNNSIIEIVDYIKNPLSYQALSKLIKQLGISPEQLIRKNEEAFKPYVGKIMSDEAYIQLMVDHPKLIQRPIVVLNNKAYIVRPPLTLSDIMQ
jgi:arsenate reductase